MCNSKSINQGQERENFNVGLVNIDEESNYSGISGWMVLEYVTFFIILLMGLQLLARCFHHCCQRLGERQLRMFTEVVQNNQSGRSGNMSEMEMNMMGSRQEGVVNIQTSGQLFKCNPLLLPTVQLQNRNTNKGFWTMTQ